MQEVLKLILGVVGLSLGIPLGNWLARITPEELRFGRVWFKLLILISLLGGAIGLFLGNDAVLFTCLFIAIVTSRSLKRRK